MMRFLGGVVTAILAGAALLIVLSLLSEPPQTPPAPATPAAVPDAPKAATGVDAILADAGIAMDVPSGWTAVPEAKWAAFLDPYPMAGAAVFGQTRLVLTDSVETADADAVIMVIHVNVPGGSLDFARSLEPAPGQGGLVTPAQAIRLNGIEGAVVATANTIPVGDRTVAATLRLVALDLADHGLYLFSFSVDGTPAAARLRGLIASIRPAP